MDDNYFPQDDGSILDCDGRIIAEDDDSEIEYDGGYFYASEVIEAAFKDNNRDAVRVTGAQEAGEAYNVAERFLAEETEEDEECSYCLAPVNCDFNDDGSIDFKVICENKQPLPRDFSRAK